MKYNLSEILETIKHRRNVKPEDFSSRKVAKEIIEKMIDAARWAPTHALTQPWHFNVFMDDGLQKFAHFHSEKYKEITPTESFKPATYELLKARPLKASAIIAIGMKRQEIEKIPEIEEIAAVACAVQNMCLVATAYGIVTYWGTGGLTYTPHMKTFLGLGEKDKCMGLLHIGYPGIEWPLGQRKPTEYYTEWILQNN